MNDSVFFDLSRKLVDQFWTEEPQIEDVISKSYFKAVGREITSERQTALFKFYQKALSIYEENEQEALLANAGMHPESSASFAALCMVGNAILNLDEVITKN